MMAANKKDILTISLARYLHGTSVNPSIAKDWEKFPEASERFNNEGFDLDANDVPTALQDLKKTLNEQHWDGIMVGWCTRGVPERTVLFEQVVAVSAEAMRNSSDTKLLFCTGPDNIAETVMRNFG